MVAMSFFLFFSVSMPIGNPSAPAKQDIYSDYHYVAYPDVGSYPNIGYQGEEIAERVVGGVVSHHFFAEKEISKFFSQLRTQRVKTVVLIGPNHLSKGMEHVQISELPYRTPWGILEPDMKILKELTDWNIASIDESSFEQEHSVSALVGFIKYTFPEAQFVPIILKRSTPQEKLDALVHALDASLPDDALVLASVDFSHHLNRFAADFHDQKSISVLQRGDTQQASNLEVDSPPSIYTLLSYLGKRGAQQMVSTNVNSAELSGNQESEDVTSYVFGYFLKGKVIESGAVSLLNFGDVMFDREVKNFIASGKDPFEKIRGVEGNFFRGIDVITANLEGPITDTATCQKKPISFRFQTSTAWLLRSTGIDAVSIANNHSNDCLAEGLTDTRDYLTKAGIGYFGNEYEYTKTVGTKKITFVGFNAFQQTDATALQDHIREIRASSDYVVVNMHWGVEYADHPNSEQRELAHKLIDAGADIIIGHHPHVVQPIEIYKNGFIAYSLGNFLFDQIPPSTKTGIGIGTVLTDTSRKIYIFPYTINNLQPELMKYPETFDFCDTYLADIPDRDGCMFELHTPE